ncbi:MAG: YfiR family protein [Candidatus Acidiferrales bacterium]
MTGQWLDAGGKTKKPGFGTHGEFEWDAVSVIKPVIYELHQVQRLRQVDLANLSKGPFVIHLPWRPDLQARATAHGVCAGSGGRRPARSALLCVAGLFVAALGFVDPGVAQAPVEEYRVKAAFLFHFVQLVDWPPGALGDEKNPLTVCMAGKDSFQGDLETTLQGKSIGTHPLYVQHLKPSPEIKNCRVVFISGSERVQVPLIIAALKDDAVLSVGESDDFIKEGGMIGFCVDNNKVRFEINVGAADRAKLKNSSRLLLLAKTVIGNHE